MKLDDYVHAVRQHLPRLEIRSVEPITGGWDFLVLEVNEDLLFRFPRNHLVKARLDVEVAPLSELAARLPVRVPEYRYDFAIEKCSPGRFVGYDKIPGLPLLPEMVKDRPQDIARQLGIFLSALHRFPVSRAKKAGVTGGDTQAWRGEYVAFYEWIQGNALHLMEPHFREASVRLWNGFLEEDFNFTFTPVLVHQDLMPHHILYEKTDGRITGVIDWTDAVIGDPAIDFAGLIGAFGDEFTDQIIECYNGDVTETLKDRARFYSAIVPFHGMRSGIVEGVGARLQEALAQIRRRLPHS